MFANTASIRTFLKSIRTFLKCIRTFLKCIADTLPRADSPLIVITLTTNSLLTDEFSREFKALLRAKMGEEPPEA
jgi:hypothetical protein